MMANHKYLITAMIVLVLFGCGGNGGSGGGRDGSYNPPAPPVTPGLQQAVITRRNAVGLMDTSFTLMDLSRSVMYDFPYLVNYVLYYAENGRYYEESACDNAGRTAIVSGDLSENDGTGEILYTYNSCVDNQYDIRTDGIIRVTIDQTDLIAFPTIYTVGFEDFETTSSNGSYGTVINGAIEVHAPSGAGQIVTADIEITDINSDLYIKADGLTIESDVPVGDYSYEENTRISGTVAYSER